MLEIDVQSKANTHKEKQHDNNSNKIENVLNIKANISTPKSKRYTRMGKR